MSDALTVIPAELVDGVVVAADHRSGLVAVASEGGVVGAGYECAGDGPLGAVGVGVVDDHGGMVGGGLGGRSGAHGVVGDGRHGDDGSVCFG